MQKHKVVENADDAPHTDKNRLLWPCDARSVSRRAAKKISVGEAHSPHENVLGPQCFKRVAYRSIDFSLFLPGDRQRRAC
ncbi:hypothetical protein Y032_0068g221 [Ancylostoma ceylanicum]|uniref:Uncharacterized protein n=1 Tax=Ancylostoma ceylanicum TaxID=53326 RepID=A0A016TY37_9BILA|nr:hypothetical protein Y032_0068g221 [Ancylostoma ceylanicum]